MSVRLNIAVFTHYFSPEGGAASHRMAGLVTYWSRLGHNITVVCPFPNYPIGRKQPADSWRLRRVERLCPSGARVIRTYVYAHPHRTAVRRLVNYISYAMSALLAVPFVGRPDVVVFSSGPLFVAIPGLIAARVSGARLVMDVRDLWPERVVSIGGISRRNPVVIALRWLAHVAEKRADLVVAVTPSLMRRLLTDHGVPEHKVKFIPNGVDLEEVDALLRRARADAPPWRTGGLRVVESGTVGLVQSPETLIRAAQLLEQRNPDWGEIVVLGDGPKLLEVRRRVAQHGLKTIRFLGHMRASEMFRYLATADVGVVSLTDNPHNELAIPRRLMDYLAAGLPVAYAGRGDGAQIVAGEGVGCVVAPEDARALADLLDWFAQAPERRRLMGARARQLAEARFDVRLLARRYLDLILETAMYEDRILAPEHEGDQ